MDPITTAVSRDTETLGQLAMQFRGTQSEAERHRIARDYAQAVDRLIASGRWNEMPAFEDQLPDDWMPDTFFDYWTEGQRVP
jgi:hypothetical protein